MTNVGPEPELPPELLDRLFRILYGPPECREDGLALLLDEHAELGGAIAAQIAAAESANAAAHTASDASLVAPVRPRHWSLSPGTSFGDYRIVEHLGSGGMGSVFAAEHVGDAERVALKVLHPLLLK